MNEFSVNSTYRKVLTLIVSSSIFFVILYFFLYFLTLREEKRVYDSTSALYNNEISKLLILESNPFSLAINNDSSWSEFYNYFKTPNNKWFINNIAGQIDVYRVDYLCTYDNNNNFLTSFSNTKIKSDNFIPKSVLLELNRVHLIRFYTKIPEGIVEIFGATVHPSNDPLKNSSKSNGYFFMARLLDTNYYSNLRKITNSEVSFLGEDKKKKSGRYKVFDTVELKDHLNNNIGKIVFKRKFDIHFQSTKNILYIIMLSFLINTVVYLIYTRKWVYHPLELIRKILETGSKTAIKKLKSIAGEFGYIGKLFEDSDNQKTELVNAKIKAEESDKLKSSFLANLSHEIRTPMNAILGFSDLLNNESLDEIEKLDYLKIIKNSGTNLICIIDDLIEMSKIDAQQVKPNLTSIGINKLINEVFQITKVTLAKDKNIDFYLCKNNSLINKNIISDSVKLKQVLVNLLTNALKFTEQGYVSLQYHLDDEGKNIVFSVKDSGVGIDEKNHKYVFDRFRRLESDVSIKAGGLGLGLAISKAYVELLGGQIYLKPNQPVGCNFTFTIPLNYSETEIDKKLVPIKSNLPETNEVLTILIAEDDSINFLLLKKILQFKNHTIIRAENGKIAVEICENNNAIDLIFMDIKMPEMSGYEATKLIRKINSKIPIIAQTAYSSIEEERKTIESSFDGFITKPLNKENVFTLINSVIKS